MQAVTVSMTGVGFTRPVRLDDFAPGLVSIQVKVTGSSTYTVESTLDDPNDPANPVAVGSMVWFPSSDANVVNATTSQQSNFMFAPKYVRLSATTGSGTATMTVLQSSNGPI